MRLRLLMPAALLLAAGCSSALVGTWKATADPPADPRFFIKQLAFRDNGTCHISARESDQDLFLHGRYEFDGMHLTLKPDGRSERRYPAVVWWGRELQITAEGEKQTLRKR